MNNKQMTPGTILALLGMSFLVLAVDANAAPTGRKVDVCHATGGPKPNIVNVSDNSLLNHIGHGDWLVTPAICDTIADNNCDGQPDGAAADTAYCVDENGPGWTCQANMCNSPPTDIGLSNDIVNENSPTGTKVGMFSTVDPDSPGPFTYTLVAGAGDTGNTSFMIAGDQLLTAAVFDFESQNSFSIRVRTDAGDGGTYEEVFTISVFDINDAPVITSDGGGATTAVNAAENQTAVTTVTATDADVPAQTLTFSISGGADAALFGIVGSTGVLTFNSAPDFENPADTGGNNVYDVQVTVTDGGAGTLTDVQDITVTVDDVNDAPVISSNGGGATAMFSVDENQTAVTTVMATDADTTPVQTLTLSISGGADAALFGLAGGVLTFNSPPDFENPTDADPDGDYEVQVTVTDDGTGTLTDVQDITVTVDDVNEAPVITSNGGGATAMFSVDENETAVTTVTATDTESPPQILTFSITGGADGALFSIVGSTGVLTFNSAPDFENPDDASMDNDYAVQVTVTDNGTGSLTDLQDITVTVDDVNENLAPVITSDGGGATASLNADENQTAVTTVTATDADVPAQTLTFSISGGADQALFGIAGGVLTFLAAPDFENPTDAGGGNVYDVQVTVTDNGAPNLTDVQDIAVTVTDVNDAPVITSDGGGANAAVNAAENQTGVTTVTATDADLPAQTLTFTISGGADQALFGLVGGVLTFNAAPDFENPTDAGGNGIYDVQVTVTDNGAPNLTDVQDIAVTVTDVNDAPVISSNGGGATASLNADENQSAVTAVMATDADLPAQTLTFTISGGADQALFDIAGGVLTFNAAPDSENPLDAGGDNVYDVQVTVTDNGAPNLTDVQDIAVTVTDVNDAPVITSDGGGANAAVNAAENQTGVTTVTATDADLPAQTLTFTISGGADQALFGLVGGVLTFNAAPDFENPTDAGGNGIYDVQVTVTDNGTPNLTDVQDIAVTVTDLAVENVAPVITSDGGGANAAVNAAENQTGVTTVTATDADLPAQTLTFTISGGADQALFGLVGGVLTFNAAPDFENPTDAGGNGIYDVQVTVTDNGAPNLTDVQDIAVTVTDVNDAPTDIGLDNTNVDENLATGATVGTFTTTDMDVTDTHTYTLVAGTGATDNAAFSIVGAGLQTAAILNFEAATNCTNSVTSCSIRVQTDDGTDTYEEVFIIDINNVNDAPVATADPYSGAIGNVLFELIPLIRGGTPVPPTVQVAGSIISNDTDEDTADTLAVTANASVATTQGGTAAVDTQGRFVYTPAAGYPGTGTNADSFDYQVCDDGAPVMCDTGTVTIVGTGIVWFVDDSSPNNPGTGVAGDAFRDLSSASGAPTAPSETIFVYAGTHTTGITLQDNQSLLGQGLNLVVNTHTLVDAGARPVISTTGTAVTLASGNTVSGLNVTGSQQGIVGDPVGSLTIDNVALNTTTGAALSLANGDASVTIDSVTSTAASANTVIALTNTGAAAIDVTGNGTTDGSGGTIANKTGDAITLNGTDGPIIFKNMIIEDIGDLAGGFNTRSGHDGIHGQDVNGGLTLDNVTIRRVSDNCVNGSLFSDGITESFWDGLEILNSTIQQCNRFHVANVADTQDEGGVRIAGLTGSVTIDNNTFDQTGEHLDLFTHSSGTLNMDVTDNVFIDAYQEYNPPGAVVSVGGFCVDVTVEGSSDANVTIGGTGNSNDFENCGTGSIRVTKDTVPAGSSNIDFVVDNNTFRVTDQTDASGSFGNTPQGGVLLRAGPGGIATFDGLVQNNTFGIAIGPDDRIGSTGEEIANADGVGGNVVLIFDSGVSQARVNNNVFNGSINAPWVNRADGNTSAAVLYKDNSYRGRDDYCCDSGFSFTVPGIPYRTQSRNGGSLDITFENDNMVHHDQFFFAQTETLEFLTRNDSGFAGGTMCMAFKNMSSADGFEFKETSGTLELYQGAVNNAATGPCGVEANGHPVSDCELEAADDGVRGGPIGHTPAGAPSAALNPPHFDVDAGSITIVPTACTLPSGGIFN